MHPKDLRWRVWCLYVGAWWGWKAKMLRYHRLWSVLSGPINSKPTFFPTYFAFPQKVPVRQEREPKQQRSDKSEKGIQKRLYPTLFDVEKVNFLLQNASYRFWKLCFLPLRGAHFCKNGEKIWPESEKCTLKSLDGDFEASTCGPGGAKKWKCWNFIGFTTIFEGSRGARVI